MTWAAIYCRVSSGRQEQEETVESQREAVRAYAVGKGYTIAEEFVDEVYSGATLERPGLDRLRDAARDERFDRLLILSPDRLARKVGYQFLILEELQKVGVVVEFLQGQPADTPEGQLLLTMQGAIAEYERAKIGERTRRGKQFWARRGGLMGGYTPYGYRYVPRDGDRRATLTPDPATAPVVRDGSPVWALLRIRGPRKGKFGGDGGGALALHKANEVGEQIRRALEFEPEGTTYREVIFKPLAEDAHTASPGHGLARAEREARSTLA